MKKITKKSIAIMVVLAVMVSVLSIVVFANSYDVRERCGNSITNNARIRLDKVSSGNNRYAYASTQHDTIPACPHRSVSVTLTIRYFFNGYNYTVPAGFQGGATSVQVDSRSNNIIIPTNVFTAIADHVMCNRTVTRSL
jgi:hypothetical protein